MNLDEQASISAALEAISKEIIRAKTKHPGNFCSEHHGYAVLLEEVDELWDEIKKQKPDRENLKTECIQIAAMAVRFLTELCD